MAGPNGPGTLAPAFGDPLTDKVIFDDVIENVLNAASRRRELILVAGGLDPGYDTYRHEAIELLSAEKYTNSFYTFIGRFLAQHPGMGANPSELLGHVVFQAQADEFLSLLMLVETANTTIDPELRVATIAAIDLRMANESEIYVQAFLETVNPLYQQPLLDKEAVEALTNIPPKTITIEGPEWTNIEAQLNLYEDVPSEAFDYIDQNRPEIVDAYKNAIASGLVDPRSTFVDWVINIWGVEGLALAVERGKSVSEKVHDPIIDPLITSLFEASNLGGSEIDTVLRRALKQSINDALIRGDHRGANKEQLFDLMGLATHENTITSTLELFFSQAKGGEAFIEALEGQGITLGSLIFDPTWATRDFPEAIDPAIGIVPSEAPYPDAFNSLADFVENVNTWATTKFPDIPQLVLSDVERLDEVKFIIDEFEDLARFPGYIRAVTIGIIQNALQTSGLELLTVENAADVSSWLNDQGGLDAFVGEAVIVGLGTVEGGDRLLSQLQAKEGQVLGDAFINFWNEKLPPNVTAITSRGFGNALINNDLIPPEPEDPDDALAKMVNSDFAGMIGPLVSGLPNALRNILIREAESYFRDEITLGGGMTPDQVMDQEGFEPGLEYVLDSVVSRYFVNDELTSILIEGLEGGVREFFEIFPDLAKENVSPEEIVRRIHDSEIRPTDVLIKSTLSPAVVTRFNEMLADEQADKAFKERGEDVEAGLAEIDLIADEQVLDWLENDPKGIEVAEAIATGRITALMQQAEDLATAADQKDIRDSAAQIEYENLKRAVGWLTSLVGLPFGDELITGKEYSQQKFDVDQQQKLLDLREVHIALPERETMVAFWETGQGREILAAKTAQDIQDIINESARLGIESDAAQQEFDQLKRAVEYFKTVEGQQLIEAEFEGEIRSRLQGISQLIDQLDFQQLEFELRELRKPQLEYQVGIAGTQIGQALGLAEEEAAFRGRLESLFMPELQRVAEQQFGRSQAADVLRTLPQEQFQQFFAEMEREIEREQRTGFKRFDPGVLTDPLDEGRVLRPEEKADYYTPEAFVSRVFEQPEVLEQARRAGRLERLRPFRAPVAGRQRRRLLGGRRSFARAERPIPA
jgi:hypothetical protein